MNLFTKITVSAFVLIFTFGVVSYFTDVDFGLKTVSASFTTSGCGSCDDGGSTPTPEREREDPEPQPLPAQCEYLRANGQTGTLNLPAGGGQVQLTWATTNAVETLFHPGRESVSPNSNKTVTVTSDQEFAISAVSSNGSADICRVAVTVADTPAISCDGRFSADDTTIVRGENTILRWNVADATRANIRRADGAPTTVAAPSGTMTVSPQNTITYYLTVSNGSNTDECPVTVRVTNPTPEAISCDGRFTVDNASIKRGESTILRWNVPGATNAAVRRIDGNPVSVATPNGNMTISPTSNTQYVLTVTDGTTSDNCIVPVTVTEKPTPSSISCDGRFSADDTTIVRGENTILRWNVADATRANIRRADGAPTTVAAPSGTMTVSPQNTITYYLTVSNGSNTDECPVKIKVVEDEIPGCTDEDATNYDDDATEDDGSCKYPSNGGGGGGSSSRPYCDLDISDKKISRGESVTLEWRTWNTRDIVLEDDDGNILIESDDDDDLDSEITIKPTKDTTYTLTANRGSRDRECEVDVEVGGGITLSQVRQQFPTVAGISLSQVPYTGFEAGPMLTFIFYALLAVWGLFVAYVVAVRKNIIGGTAFAGVTSPASTGATAASVVPETSNTTYSAAATAAAPSNLPTAPVVGYAAMSETSTVVEDEQLEIPEMTEAEIDASMQMTELENRAHMQNALFSSDAMRYFTKVTPETEQMTALDTLIAKAKGSFPTEDGWIVLNLARIETLMSTANAAEVVTETGATTGGSLAEAIVTGNVVAAYQMISNRPMIALADAAAELDAVVRSRRGEAVTISNLLQKESANLSDEQIRAATHALTSALDGVYTSEEDAVKMAIMKAVKAVA